MWDSRARFFGEAFKILRVVRKRDAAIGGAVLVSAFVKLARVS